MDQLLAMEPVTSIRDLRGLRRFYGRIEANVRGLKALGILSQSYGSLLSSILMKCLPKELHVAISKQISDEFWDLEELMKVLENEIEARERADIVVDNDCQANRRNMKGGPTTSTLIAGDDSSALNCCYCRQSHSPNSCKAVNTTEAKRQILRRSGRCFICLKRGYIGRYCRSGLKCSSCNEKHHTSAFVTQPREPVFIPLHHNLPRHHSHLFCLRLWTYEHQFYFKQPMQRCTDQAFLQSLRIHVCYLTLGARDLTSHARCETFLSYRQRELRLWWYGHLELKMEEPKHAMWLISVSVQGMEQMSWCHCLLYP